MELLELYLSPLDNPTEFKVIVTQSPAGQGESKSSLPFLDVERDWRITVIRTLEISNFDSESFSEEEQEWMGKVGILGSDRSTFHPNYLVNIGQALYNALFPQGSEVEQVLWTSIRLAEKESTKLVVQLKLEADVVQKTRLADYPWELLHNRHFLCHHQVEFSRYIAYQAVPPNLPTSEKLNVLLVSSGASDKELDLEPFSKKEQKAVGKGLKTASERGDISLEQLEEPTFAKLRTYLTEHPGKQAPHVLHFDGHGLFGKRCHRCSTMNSGPVVERCRNCNAELPLPQGYLVFEDEDGDADYISARELGTLLQQSAFSDGSSQTGGVVLVVLSACQSGMAIVGESVFNGAAQNLIAHRIPGVVAMQYSVRVDSATKFAEQFYRSLGQKNSLAVAVSQGRAAMGVEGNQWYRPVLYLRWQDNEGGKLFAPSQSTSQNTIIKKPTPHIDFTNDSEENSPDLDLYTIPQLLQGYIQARDLRRSIIGSVFCNRAIIDSRILNADNATQILEPLLEKLVRDSSVEERVDAALHLVEAFFRPYSHNSSTRIDFLPHQLLRITVNVLLAAAEDDTASNDAIPTAAIWALSWLTTAITSVFYTVYAFTEGELDRLRRIARNDKRDALARSRAALILSICTSEKTVFAQADWIYEWVAVADGDKPQRQLPVMRPLNRPKDVNIFKDLISSDLPIKAKGQVALALGRLGYFMYEMIEPLLQIFQNEGSSSFEREEALVYLVLTGGHQVVSVLKREVSSNPFENDVNKYDLLEYCLSALVGMGDVDELEYLLDLGGEQYIVDAYAYALAGVTDPRGREILEFMKNHKKNRVRSAVAKALSKLNQWNFSGGQSNKSSLSNNNSTTIRDRMISKQGYLVHKIKAKDSSGRWAYYFVHVSHSLEQVFLEGLNSNENMDLEDYGRVIGSCYGEEPNQELRDFLKEKYGFDV